LVVTGLAILVSVWFLNNRTVKKSKAKEEGSKTGVGEKKAASEGGKEEGEKKTWHSKMAMFRGLRKRPKNNELHGDDESRPGT
jgi:hypothetical protein